ncbi:threonine aspartase [Xylariales sp. AK1849]|nr:threonine aspartase [Xylariales sp. AK1849]
MKLLKTGGLAVEGVEAAIKILEDKEITNAGFGSNLAIDGNVECDATLVDHLGRSGACGAVPNIKNPISLAKSVLEKSNIPLTLRRVPPNLLVGKGAKDFAWENGMPLVPNDWLVSKNAKDRFVRWKEDLDRASARGPPTPNAAQRLPIPEYRDETRQKTQRDHHNAILMGTWNEGQPDSPANPATPLENAGSPGTTGSSTKSNSPLPNSSSSPRPTLRDSTGRSPLSFLGSLTSPRTAPNIGSSRTGSPVSKKPRFHASEDGIPRNSDDGKPDEIETSDRASSLISTPTPMATTYLTMLASQIDSSYIDSSSTDVAHSDDEDRITDTVGAIAIDQWGNMAAGSSSGGIGMKHRGRVGPAALVGVGTAIIPADPHDDDQVVVGAVTSGTGEHMATTMASQKCAERLYHGTRRGEGGLDITEAEESVVMESFIVKDFQNHPGVLNSSSASAIGAMAIKQTRNGYYLYFAHNTDSFALASMCSGDRQPHCVMSRLKEGSTGVAQGARKIRTE